MSGPAVRVTASSLPVSTGAFPEEEGNSMYSFPYAAAPDISESHHTSGKEMGLEGLLDT